MVHAHTNSTPTLNANDTNRSFIIGIALNIIYVMVELWYGFQNESTSLVSDAAHNIGDISDGVPSSINTDEITHHLLEIKGVEEIHHIHIWSISTNENGLTCHVKIDDLENIPTIKEKIKDELAEHNITHSTLEFEINTENCNG